MPEPDLFAGFERMRREMDELFGDVLERSFGGRRAGFSPRVDVSYAADPPRAIVTPELAGITTDDLELEVRGRELVIAGHPGPVDETEGRVVEQIEIDHGPVPRTRQRGAEVAADACRPPYNEAL